MIDAHSRPPAASEIKAKMVSIFNKFLDLIKAGKGLIVKIIVSVGCAALPHFMLLEAFYTIHRTGCVPWSCNVLPLQESRNEYLLFLITMAGSYMVIKNYVSLLLGN